MKDGFKKSLTEGNKVDVRNLAEILMQISEVSRRFALELCVYAKGGDDNGGRGPMSRQRRSMR